MCVLCEQIKKLTQDILVGYLLKNQTATEMQLLDEQTIIKRKKNAKTLPLVPNIQSKFLQLLPQIFKHKIVLDVSLNSFRNEIWICGIDIIK